MAQAEYIAENHRHSADEWVARGRGEDSLGGIAMAPATAIPHGDQAAKLQYFCSAAYNGKRFMNLRLRFEHQRGHQLVADIRPSRAASSSCEPRPTRSKPIIMCARIAAASWWTRPKAPTMPDPEDRAGQPAHDPELPCRKGFGPSQILLIPVTLHSEESRRK